MRVILFTLLCIVSAMSSAADTKVAVIDMERALFLSDAAKTSIQQFENDNRGDIDKLKAIQQDVVKTREKLDKEGDIMSEDDRRKMMGDIEEKSQEFQFYSRKLKQLEDKWKRGFFNQQLPELEVMLKEIIDLGKYDLVLNAGSVVYAVPTVDLTKQLLEKLNTRKK